MTKVHYFPRQAYINKSENVSWRFIFVAIQYIAVKHRNIVGDIMRHEMLTTLIIGDVDYRNARDNPKTEHMD